MMSKDPVEQYEEVHTCEQDHKGWTVTLSVWRNRIPMPNGNIEYLALLSTGHKEAGKNLAAMDCDYVFSHDAEDVVETIKQSIKEERAMYQLVSQAERSMTVYQTRLQGGRRLLS